MNIDDYCQPIYANVPHCALHFQVSPAQQKPHLQFRYPVYTPEPPGLPPPQVTQQVSRTPSLDSLSFSGVSKSEGSSNHSNSNRRISPGRERPESKTRQEKRESGKSSSLGDKFSRALIDRMARQPEVARGVAWEKARNRKIHSNDKDERHLRRDKH
ncbi:hypothetical protein sscle_03g030600 [Sclerotinia sclerotiorum 1980 UF-70]|uniref:Uncharacterized protein n=1 Tax=Sclerotinia sclerotiorum (strain ATCC 18683 / 1980 / Ss-1) TaxID=665079 RepID=A0A1D9Q006_SCLS1|nr:hypothetical protein sscle_03g030600 [Sclerotinia sclerotiorum 1980 UF-70]